jgi:acetyl esterase/lipase
MRRRVLKNIGWILLGMAIVPRSFAQYPRERPMGRGRDMAGGRAGMADEMDSGDGPDTSMPLPADTRVERNVSYGPDPVQRMDVYRAPKADKAPVMVMVHGGGWMRGDKGATRVVKNKVAHWVPKGYVFVSLNYRMSPQADPLEQASDVAKAIAYVQSNAKSWGGDPARLVVIGHSSGAHLVSLLTADPAIASRQGAKPWLGTVALDSAAYDVVEIMGRPHFRFYDRVFTSDPDFWREASPTRRLTRAPVPTLIVCSSRRNDSCPQAKAYAAKATSLGGKVSVVPMDLTHAEINEMLGTPGEYTRQVDAFLRALGLE